MNAAIVSFRPILVGGVALLALLLLALSCGGSRAAGTAVSTRTPTPLSVTRLATPTAAQTRAPTPTPRLYTVQTGDTLSQIATRFGVTVQALMDANQITDPNRVKVGDKLVIPGPATPAPTSTSPGATATRATPRPTP